MRRGAHGVFGPGRVVPGASVRLGIARGVRAQDRAGRTELAPAGIGLFVAPAHVTADVVGPEEAADVARRGCERHLEGEHRKARIGVPGEMDRVPVVAPPRPAGEGQAALPVLGGVVIQEGIQPEQVGQVGDGARVRVLLPVQPPEVYPVFLQGREDGGEQGVHVRLGTGIERQRLLCGGVCPHALHEGGVAVLVRGDAIGGMQVQSDMQTLRMEPGQEGLGVGEQLAVPGPAGPAVFVPVHVQHHVV